MLPKPSTLMIAASSSTGGERQCRALRPDDPSQPIWSHACSIHEAIGFVIDDMLRSLRSKPSDPDRVDGSVKHRSRRRGGFADPVVTTFDVSTPARRPS